MKVIMSVALALVAATGTCLAQTADFSNSTNKDAPYIMDCAQAGLAEVTLANIALKNAESLEVKDFAKQMIQDHTKANQALKVVAAKQKIKVPGKLNSEKEETASKMRGLTGKSFDKAYCSQMVTDHTEVSRKLESHLAQGNADLQNWTKETLPKVKHHLEMAQSLNDKIQK